MGIPNCVRLTRVKRRCCLAYKLRKEEGAFRDEKCPYAACRGAGRGSRPPFP